jgi:hypothetical protein
VRRAYLKPKSFLKRAILFFCIITLGACTVSEKPSIEEQVKKLVPFPKSTNILHIEDHTGGKMILYKDKSGFRAAFYKEEDDYLQSTSNAELTPRDGFNWTMDNNSDMAIFAGVITDKKIKTVIVKQRTIEQQAKIIDIPEGERYWFTTFEVLEDSQNGEPDPLKIEAFDMEGKLYWKSGVYEDGVYEGKTN